MTRALLALLALTLAACGRTPTAPPACIEGEPKVVVIRNPAGDSVSVVFYQNYICP
jgi:hypothetical protein